MIGSGVFRSLPQLRACTQSPLHRVRALALLIASLATPVALLAASVFGMSSSICCGSEMGAMCPMHHNQNSKQEKMSCQGRNQAQQTCMCAPHDQSQPMISQFAPKATVEAFAIAFLPRITFEVPLFSAARILIRSISPPDQPPRR
jgi:hypothetical protein